MPKALELWEKIRDGKLSARIDNISALINAVQEKISLNYSYKTFEFDLIRANISKSKNQIEENLLWSFLFAEKLIEKKFRRINEYIGSIAADEMTETELGILHILIWKALPPKAEFAQDFSVHLLENLDKAKVNFIVPKYIHDAITHLINFKFE
jgi:putative ATP-dependent endonuclease of OLD family